MTLTAYPGTKPQRNDRSTFSTRADAFVTWWLDTFYDEFNTEVTAINALAAAMNLNDTTDTSSTSNSVDGGTDAKTFTVSASKSFSPGQFLIIADSAAPTTNYMLAQVVSYSGTTLDITRKGFSGSGTKTSWNITFTAYPSLPFAGTAKTIVHTGNGHGSTNTSVRRFTTTITDSLSSYTDSSTLGGYFTIPASGVYSVTASDVESSTAKFGVSLNSSQLTTAFDSITEADKFFYIGGTTATGKSSGRTSYLAAGDILRLHTDGTMTNSDPLTRMIIERLF